MRLKNHLTKSNLLNEYLNLCETLNINEMSTDMFAKIQEIGKKMGFKVKKSKSLIDYLKGMDKGIEDLLRYATLYMMTDIKDSKTRLELVKNAKDVLKRVDKKDIAAMLIQLDKSTVGLTSHIRHIFQSVFGIEITTINYWYDDVSYIKKELKNIRVILNKMGNMKKQIEALDAFEDSLKSIFDTIDWNNEP